jgi:hypothetical protein
LDAQPFSAGQEKHSILRFILRAERKDGNRSETEVRCGYNEDDNENDNGLMKNSKKDIKKPNKKEEMIMLNPNK